MADETARRILLIDDDEDEFVLTRELFAEMRSEFELVWEGSYEAGLEALVRGGLDCCLVDYRLGARTGLELIREAHQRGSLCPMILLTGHDEREVDLEALRAGAADYVSKNRLPPAVLERSILYALARQEASRAKVELAVSERSRELVIEQVTDYAIILIAPDATVASWNAGAERLKGYRAEEIVGQSLNRFYTPEDLAKGRPDHQLKMAAEHGRYEDEGWCVRKDGSRFWANLVITAIRDPAGLLRGFAEVARDVTEQRRLTFLGEASAILTSSLDYQTTLSRVARLCVPFLADWSSLQILEQGKLNTVAVEHPDPEKVALATELNRRFPEDPATGPTWRAIRTGQSQLFAEITDQTVDETIPNAEHRAILKKLGLRSAMFVPLISQGRTLGALTLIAAESGRRYGPADLDLARDLADRCGQAIDNARAHAALQVEREFLDGVVRQMREGVLVAEAEHGEMILANDEALRLLRVETAEELLEQSADYRDASGRKVPPDQLPLMRALRTGAPVAPEEFSFPHEGQELTLSVAAAPVKDRNGRTLGAVATFRDVTERKQAEARAAEEAEGRELFFGILGHDLRNPLSAIVTASHILLRKGLPESQAKTVGRIASSAERMSKLVSDLLDLTRTRLAGGIPIVRSPVRVGPLCRKVVDEIAISHPDCDLKFEAQGDPTADLDPDRVAQVVSNLVGNAVEYGCSTPVRMRLTDAGDHVELEVHNGGEPIPKELLPVIFDPFRRAANQAEAGNRQGLGLGLYITQEIVSGHGGSITVTSDRERGTTFRVVLPKHAPSSAFVSDFAPPSPSPSP